MVQNILLVPRPFGVIQWGLLRGGCPVSCVGPFLAHHDFFKQAAALTKSHYHSDPTGCLSWVSNRICLKELSSWQPGETGGLCFLIHSLQSGASGNLGWLSHKDSNCWEMNCCRRRGSPGALGCTAAPPSRVLPLPSRQSSQACRLASLSETTSQEEEQPLVGGAHPTQVPCLPSSKQSLLSQ